MEVLPPDQTLTRRQANLDDAVVRINWSGPDGNSNQSRITVQSIFVVGRPAHAFTKGEGNHTTAWSVLVDRVRREIVGRTLEDAVAKVDSLIEAYQPAGRDAATAQGLSGHRWEKWLYATNLGWRLLILGGIRVGQSIPQCRSRRSR
jgi:hypothetical protein